MKYVIRDSGCKFINIDRESGGYPYIVDSIFDAKIFNTKEKAEEYIKIFHKIKDWSIFEILYVQIANCSLNKTQLKIKS